jgi:hypothetical protein
MAENVGGDRELLPGQALGRALSWLDERVRDAPGVDRARLVGDAAMRFDLTPVEEEFLLARWVRGE